MAKSEQDLKDEETINKMIPRYARVLNYVYERTFAPLDRLVERVRSRSTRKMVEAFEAAEAKKSS